MIKFNWKNRLSKNEWYTFILYLLKTKFNTFLIELSKKQLLFYFFFFISEYIVIEKN